MVKTTHIHRGCTNLDSYVHSVITYSTELLRTTPQIKFYRLSLGTSPSKGSGRLSSMMVCIVGKQVSSMNSVEISFP